MVGEDLQIKKESESLPESSKQPKEEYDTTAQSKSDAKNPKNRNSERRKSSFMKSPGDFLPMIRRGILGDAYEKETKDVVSVGWKVEVTNRKEREESLRYVSRPFIDHSLIVYPCLTSLNFTFFQR